MIRTLPTAVCGWRAVAVESYAAPAKADTHASISSRLYLFLHYKRGRDGVEMPRVGYQRGPYKRYGQGLCCASRKCVFTTKHRRASPVRATKSAASPLCCSEEGGVEGRPRYQTSHPPAYPIYHARVQPVRCQRRSARGIRSLLKPALRPQRQIHTRRFPGCHNRAKRPPRACPPRPGFVSYPSHLLGINWFIRARRVCPREGTHTTPKSNRVLPRVGPGERRSEVGF